MRKWKFRGFGCAYNTFGCRWEVDIYYSYNVVMFFDSRVGDQRLLKNYPSFVSHDYFWPLWGTFKYYIAVVPNMIV